MSQKMRFGSFIVPFHDFKENPTLALGRDLELVEHLEKLDFHEAWFGEHHSAGEPPGEDAGVVSASGVIVEVVTALGLRGRASPP